MENFIFDFTFQVGRLSFIGGKDPTDKVKRIICAIMEDSVQTQFNRLGRNRKMAFLPYERLVKGNSTSYIYFFKVRRRNIYILPLMIIENTEHIERRKRYVKSLLEDVHQTKS